MKDLCASVVSVFKYVKGYLVILLGIATGPGLLLLFPFILTPTDYGRVFGFIVTVQFISIFSSLGLEVIGARENLPLRLTLAVLSVTTLLATIIYYLAGVEAVSVSSGCLAFCTALANNLSLVIQNGHMFRGDATKYASFGIYRAILLVATLIVCVHARIEVEFSWAIASITSAIFLCLLLRIALEDPKRLQHNQWSIAAVRDVLYAALPVALLNSFSGLPFILERIMAKAWFEPGLFSKYAICNTLLMPLVYIGNMSQNYLISHHVRIDGRAVLGSIRLISFLSCGYLLIIFLVGYLFYPAYFGSRSQFCEVAVYSSFWITFYCVFAFPLAAVTQKQADAITLMKCAVANMVVILMVCVFCFWFLRLGVLLDRPWKASSMCALLVGLILVVRFYYVWPLTRSVPDAAR